MANAGAATGSTWPATPTPTATASTRRASIWPYRDWVIDALNRDMPFDQFTIEQLAGDLLPERDHRRQKIATGFHRNTQINEEGGIDKEQFRVEAVIDRVNTTGLGLPRSDRRLLPVPRPQVRSAQQREYYQLFAFFNNQDEPNLVIGKLAPDTKRRRSPRSQEVPREQGQSRSDAGQQNGRREQGQRQGHAS